jgi:hypothetical protein
MGTLGKVFAILNVLAAVGFVLVAAMDYGIRQSWTLRIQQQDLVIQGLPVDETDKDVEGEPVVNQLTPGMEKRLFDGITGAPVATQKAEVVRVKAEVLQRVTGAPNQMAQRKELADFLVPLQRSLGERLEMRKLAQAGNPEDLINKAFQPALEGTKTSGDRNMVLESDERRLAIAHVLFTAARDPAARQRTVVVVGIEMYVREVTEQAAAYQAMIPPLQDGIARDRADFVHEYDAVMQEIRYEDELIKHLDTSLVEQVKLRDDLKNLVGKRKANIDELNQDIAKAKAKKSEDKDEQERLERKLFQAQQKSAAANEENQRLEREMKNREQKRKEGGR